MDIEQFNPAYLVTLDEIYHAHWAARRRRRIAMLRDAVNHLWPEGHPTRLIHITGTNGKGSVAHYLMQAFATQGETATWTGPHVFDYAERLHIHGKKADHADIVRIYQQRLRPLQDRYSRVDTSFTFAEIGILLALCLFEEKGAQWGIMEVGNGGRYTPLMALPAEACVLTNVGDDHPKSLGAALWQRALEKAGLAREGTPFFTSAIGEALDYVKATAESEGAPVTVVAETDWQKVADLSPTPSAPHVNTNKALALAVFQHFFPAIPIETVFPKLLARLPARFWQREEQVIVDVAHNANKIEKLASELAHTYPGERFHFILGLSRSRDAAEVFAPLFDIADGITITSASHAGQDPWDIARVVQPHYPAVEVELDPARAYQQVRTRLNPHQRMVLTGSAYMIDQAINPNPFIKETNATYGRRYKIGDDKYMEPPKKNK